MDNKKRAIIIRGDKTKWYEEMIVVLRHPEDRLPPNVVKEAENIIREYIKSRKDIKTEIKPCVMPSIKTGIIRSRRDSHLILNIAIFAVSLFIFCLIYYIMSGAK